MINWVPEKDINYKIVEKLLNDSLETKQFTNYGPNVKKLEQYVKNTFEINDNKSVIVVTNASLGIQILSHAISVFEDKKINWATQSFTFPPSNQGTLNNSVILDIDIDGGLNLDEVTEDINGIIVTNIFGNIVDIDKYVDYCDKNNKFLLFDNAATSYTFYKNKNCSNYGHGSIVSFHHTKPLGFGEGGAIIVNAKYENIIRKLINFGIDLHEDKYYSVDGNNSKMSDISAAFILQYFYDNFDKIISIHKKLYDYFIIKTQNLNITMYPSFHDENKNLVSCFCVLFNSYDESIKVEKKLLENNIFCRKYYNPLKKTVNTMYIYDRILCVPCHKDMTFENIDKIVDIISSIY